jgi:hypothetical protein
MIVKLILVRGSYLKWNSMSYLECYHIHGVILSLSNRTYKIHADLSDLCQGEKPLRIKQCVIHEGFGEVQNLRG